jgi:ATP-binding cassette, subfamily A (ABC1), member 3
MFGINVFEEMDQIREILGVCPQFNVLFDQLTPEEHFDIFWEFKGVQDNNRSHQIKTMLDEVDLTEQKRLLSKNLSGGQKRKVNVGIALLGGSKIVLLDEPSSGLDPTARRRLWDMLKRHKQNRIIILTTHFMEEADILGDRIAIMTKGKSSCCGSSLFLKKKFGVGYNLTIDKVSKELAPQIDAFIQARIEHAKKLSEVSSEVTFQLPNESTKKFKEFFQSLDERKKELGVKSYGIGVTTLEEVFLKVCEGKQISGINDIRSESYQNLEYQEDIKTDDYSLVDEAVTGFDLVKLQIYAMTVWRIKMLLRQWRPLIFEVIYPSLLIIFGAVIMALSLKASNITTNVKLADFPVHQEFSYSEFSAKVSQELSKEVIDSYFNNDMFTPIHREFDQSGNVRAQFERFDNVLFNHTKRDQTYGATYFRDINIGTEKNSYDAWTFIDISSHATLAYFTEFMSNALMRHSTGDSELTLNLSYGPFPRSKVIDGWLTTTMAIMTVVSFSLAVGSITSAIAANIVIERNETVKHQQIISGSSLFAYWVSMYFVDILKFILPASSFIFITYLMDFEVNHGWMLLILLIVAILPFTYWVTFLFTKDSSVRTTISYIQFFSGGFMSLIMFAFTMLNSGGNYIRVIKWVLRFQPGFAFCNGIVQLVMHDSIPILKGENIYSMEHVGGDILFLIAVTPLYFFILYLIESDICSWRSKDHNEDQLDLDEDVLDEERRLDHSIALDYQVRVKNLRKVYNDRGIKKVAVQELSFGVQYGEWFSLLGVNGAGKTTTFKILTGDIKPNRGKIHINGYNVLDSSELAKARKFIGYWPQFDALFNGLTVREHLEFYARIKGVIPSMRREVVRRKIKQMDLTEYENTKASYLSGGNKRKLSVAMAMIGNPPIVFLDEPSTGMDPKAKRFMWSVISNITTLKKKSAVILTTHSMEEADALSTKLGIMVNGHFKWFGTVQHLKSKFGNFYEVEFKTASPSDEEAMTVIQQTSFGTDFIVTEDNFLSVLRESRFEDIEEEFTEIGFAKEILINDLSKQGVDIVEFVQYCINLREVMQILADLSSKYGQLEIIEHYGSSYKVKLSALQLSVGKIFEVFEDDYKQRYHISDYSVTQATLEQIFNSFAKEQYSQQPTRVIAPE